MLIYYTVHTRPAKKSKGLARSQPRTSRRKHPIGGSEDEEREAAQPQSVGQFNCVHGAAQKMHSSVVQSRCASLHVLHLLSEFGTGFISRAKRLPKKIRAHPSCTKPQIYTNESNMTWPHVVSRALLGLTQSHEECARNRMSI